MQQFGWETTMEGLVGKGFQFFSELLTPQSVPNEDSAQQYEPLSY